LLPGGPGDIGGDNVGCVPVKGGPGPVIPHRHARISVRGSLLDIPERDACVKGSRDECMPKCVRPYRLGDSGPAGYPAHDPGGAVPVQPPAIWARLGAQDEQ
jgi:hypothetical protein